MTDFNSTGALPVIDSGEKAKLIQQIMAQHGQWIRILAKDSASGDGWKDLEQDIYLALVLGLDSFAGRSRLSTWVYSVAQNTVLNFKRKSRRTREKDELASALLVERNHDPERILMAFIHSLSEPDRQVFMMYLSNVGYDEMSAHTGVDEPNLRKRLSRIKEQFKEGCGGF